jgi:hypothetical protein
MINEVAEIEAWTPEIVSEQVRRYRGGQGLLSAEATGLLIAFLNLEHKDRAAVLAALPAFVCMECGEPSCLHGYSDE